MTTSTTPRHVIRIPCFDTESEFMAPLWHSAPMSAEDLIQFSVHDRIAVITLNRPDQLNALLPGMGRTYAQLLRQADADPNIRGIVVTGAGRGFCAGADLSILAQGPDALAGFLADQRLEDLPTVALTLRTPVVTAINGPCAGIGFVLAMAADRRIGAPTARCGTTFAQLGLVAEYGIAWLLPQLIGLPRATDLLLTGRLVDAKEALHLGLLDEVADDPVEAATAWVTQIADDCAPSAVGDIKRQLFAAQRQTLDEALMESLRLMGEAFTRADLGEALRAKLEKRPPQF
jgi:enoyl-CoA hydratase/carnithine racemase